MQPYRAWIDWARLTPGALVLHPLSVLAVVVAIINDHFLKAAAPGLITGKLSDVAGLVFFPLAIVSLLEIGRRSVWPAADRPRWISLAALLTGVSFAIVKTVPAATAVYNDSLGILQWLVGLGWLAHRAPVPTAAVTDPSDLLALPAVAAGLWMVTSSRPAGVFRSRLSPIAVACGMTVVAVTTIATSPAHRYSSTTFEEALQLTREEPAVTRHFTVDITNRDPKLADLVLGARSYTKGTYQGIPSELETPGVLVTLVADDSRIGASGYYPGRQDLDLVDACAVSCRQGATVVVRLTDPESAAAGPIDTILEVGLSATADEEGTGPVDIDLGLQADEDRAFQGKPVMTSARRSGSVHIGADQPQLESAFEIVVDAAALQQPYGYPLVGEVVVWHDNKRAIGHPNAHSTAFEFESPVLPPDRYEYGWIDVGSGWLDEPQQPPETVDLLPLCEPESECRIHATLFSSYDAYLNDPERPGQSAVPGSIDFDWQVEVRLLAFDGREFPEGAIRFTGLD